MAVPMTEADRDRILREIILNRADTTHCYWILDVPGVAACLQQHLGAEIEQYYEDEQRDKAEEAPWFDDEPTDEEEDTDGE